MPVAARHRAPRMLPAWREGPLAQSIIFNTFNNLIFLK
jgi:hypothetical protein